MAAASNDRLKLFCRVKNDVPSTQPSN